MKLTNGQVADWLNLLAPFDRKNENVILAIFSVLGIPPTYLDIGSGTGAMVNLARKLGSEAIGIDLLPRPDWDHLIEHDLTEPINLDTTFCLITSIEVAEHIPAEHAEAFLDNIARHANSSTILVFSAAMPGQGGEAHVNTQPAKYWRDKLYERGFEWDERLTCKIALALSVANQSMHWIESNLQVFRHV